MTTLVRISDTDLKDARERSADTWDVGNKFLYQLCRDCPSHSDAREVVAKIWIIGRSYAAAFERSARKLHTREGVDALYMKAAKRLARCGLDSQLDGLAADGPQRIDDLARALDAHACVLRALSPLTRSTPRSFVSKYLHFHAPAWFFIYDSVSARGLRRILGNVRAPAGLPNIGDREYRKHVERAWMLRESLLPRMAQLTTRELDNVLVRYGA